MPSRQNPFKYIDTPPAALQLQELPTEPKQRRLFNIKVPNINTLIAGSSGFVSGIKGLAGKFWEKKKPHIEVERQESEGSSRSIIYEESPDILILNRHKLHGRKERFSREFAINPKKLRVGRYSEYMPRKRLELQIDEDVQPQISTLRESILIQRNRTESCYPRLQHHKSSKNNFRTITLQSGDSVIEKNISLEIADDDDEPKILIDEGKMLSPRNIHVIMEKIEGKNYSQVNIAELNSYVVNPSLEDIEDKAVEDENPLCKSHIEGRSEIEEISEFHASCMGELHPEPEVPLIYLPDMDISRSNDSVSVSIDGKIFDYFEKSQLCRIPVFSFSKILTQLRNFEITIDKPWLSSKFIQGLCCMKPKKLDQDLERDLESIIGLSQMEFNFTDDLHLILLLATYTSVSGESDWPNNSAEWLEVGFTTSDLEKELKNGGLVGLLFVLYLSSRFPKFFKEMLEVSRYYSFEVFQVCKHFARTAVELLRIHKLHKYFQGESRPIEVLFLFYTGMVMHWFSLVVKNKDFNEVFETVISEASSLPRKFIDNAKKNSRRALKHIN